MTRSGQVSNRRRSERLRQLRATGALTRWLRRHHLTAGMRLRTAAIGLFLVACAGAFAFVLMTQLAPDRSGTVQSPAQAQANASPPQGNATTTPHPSWVGVKSSQPDDIRAAARATTTFQNVLPAQTPLGTALRTGILGTPVLVHAYRPTPGMLDAWVIPVLQGANAH